MASEEQNNNEIKQRPLNLFDKILQKCQQISIKEEKVEQKTECKEEKEEEIVAVTAEDPCSIVDKICSSDGTYSTATKLKLLTFLSNLCDDNPKLYEIVGSSPFVYFAEKLLSDFSKAIYPYSGPRQVTKNDMSELVLIIPMLKLLALSANMSIQKIRASFLYKSEVLLQLMQAAVQCSYNSAITLKRLGDAVLNKNLTGALFKMKKQQVEQLFSNYLGIQVPSLDLKLQGYHVTLFEISNMEELNINQDIIKNRPLSGRKYTGTEESSEPDPILDCCEHVDSAEWSDIVVARVAFMKTLFVYTKEDWQDCLTGISTCVKEILLKMDIDTVHKHHIGVVYGFWSSNADIAGQPLMMVPCLRGQVLSLNGDWAMLWIVDLGLLGFIPKAKLYPLSQEMVDLPWLISICLLRGPVCKLDEVFLKAAYKVLCIILETNAQTGKHMLLFETGRHILNLIEYPETSVRISVFKLLLSLAKNSKEVVKFLREQQYDHTLLDKLEKYGHAYTASLFMDKKAMEEEIEVMLNIVLLILEQREDIDSWPQNRRASRVIWMYMCDKKCEWRELLEKCLSVLTRKSMQNQQNNSRNNQQFRKRFNHNANTQGTGFHQTKNYSVREIQSNSHENDREWNSQRYVGQRGRRDSGNRKDYDYKRNGTNSGNTRWSGYNSRRHTYNRYEGPSRFIDKKSEMYHPRDSEQEYGDNNAKTGELADNSMWEDEGATLMRRVETDDRMMCKQDHPAPFRPRLPKLNTLRKPTNMSNRVSATYHGVLEPCDTPVVDNIEVKETCPMSLEAEVDYVVYGTKANVKWDKTHELILGNKLWDIKEVVLAQKLCGLLNNNIEGSMYFGLNEDSTIEGIWFGRGEKDTFRNGIDRIMNRCLIPEVRANSYDIIFTPVLRSHDKLTDVAKQSLFIVEIRVRPLVHMVYMVFQNRKCYTRIETDTLECTTAQKKQDMMDDEERNIQECMLELEAVANNDLATLFKFTKEKYIPDSEL